MSALRPPTEDDAPEVARLMSEHAPERVDAAEVANVWTWPTVDVRSDARIGEGVYVLVEDIGEARGWIDVQGRPATGALDWAEGRLREKGGRRAFTGGWSTNERLPGALETRGYRRTRSSWRMEVPLEAAPPEPWSPDGIAIRARHVRGIALRPAHSFVRERRGLAANRDERRYAEGPDRSQSGQRRVDDFSQRPALSLHQCLLSPHDPRYRLAS